jgi:FkbM family methyltransferase
MPRRHWPILPDCFAFAKASEIIHANKIFRQVKIRKGSLSLKVKIGASRKLAGIIPAYFHPAKISVFTWKKMNQPHNQANNNRLLIERRIRLRKWEWRLRRLFTRYARISTRQGIFELDLKDESISWKMFVQKQYELKWTNRVVKFLEEKNYYKVSQKGTVLDVGANNGVISIGMLYLRQFYRGIAIEPEPHNFSLLQKNVILNQLQNRMICLPYAISDKQGELEFEISKRYLGVHRVKRKTNTEIIAPLSETEKREIVKVPSDTLEQVLLKVPAEFLDNIHLIWIDIQGHEGYAFQGSGNLFSRDIPVVTELWPYGILSGGMTAKTYCQIAEKFWKYYWMLDEEQLTRHLITELAGSMEVLEKSGKYTNIILTK